MASSSSTPSAPDILVATVIPGTKNGGIAYLLGQRQVNPEIGTWFFPSDELKPGEKVEAAVQRALKQVGKTLPGEQSCRNRILDHIPAWPLMSMRATSPKTTSALLSNLTTVFVYCAVTEELSEKEPPQKIDKLAYFSWNEMLSICPYDKPQQLPFTALYHFCRKDFKGRWDRNFANASV